eukprot:g425.t1
MRRQDGNIEIPNIQNKVDRIAVLAIAYHNIGVEQEFLKKFDQCAHSYKKGVEIADAHLGSQHGITITLRNSYHAARRSISKRRVQRGVTKKKTKRNYRSTSSTRLKNSTRKQRSNDVAMDDERWDRLEEAYGNVDDIALQTTPMQAPKDQTMQSSQQQFVDSPEPSPVNMGRESDYSEPEPKHDIPNPKEEEASIEESKTEMTAPPLAEEQKEAESAVEESKTDADVSKSKKAVVEESKAAEETSTSVPPLEIDEALKVANKQQSALDMISPRPDANTDAASSSSASNVVDGGDAAANDDSSSTTKDEANKTENTTTTTDETKTEDKATPKQGEVEGETAVAEEKTTDPAE